MQHVLNFKKGKPSFCVNESANLRVILWAGDCLHDGITDIERLPNFDVYICSGYPEGIQENIDYNASRSIPGIICIIDVASVFQMEDFIGIFRDKCKLIDSDYNGNTPTLKQEYYEALLCENGTAHNIRGINGLQMPQENFYNALELFVPFLTPELKEQRRWTKELLQLAKDNNLLPGHTWTSPDLKIPYYYELCQRQTRFSERQKERNTVQYSESDCLEEYWTKLSARILTANLERIDELSDIIHENIDRFRLFLSEFTEKYIHDKEFYRNYIHDKPLSVIQKIYSLSQDISPRLVSRFEEYHDIRKEGSPVVYGQCIEKK